MPLNFLSNKPALLKDCEEFLILNKRPIFTDVGKSWEYASAETTGNMFSSKTDSKPL